MYACNSPGCRYTTEDRAQIKNHAVVLGHHGWIDTSRPLSIPTQIDPKERISMSMEMAFTNVDTEVLGILTGGVLLGKKPPLPTFAIEVCTPIKRTFWQWLRRKPVQYTRYYIPHARLVGPEVSGNKEE